MLLPHVRNISSKSLVANLKVISQEPLKSYDDRLESCEWRIVKYCYSVTWQCRYGDIRPIVITPWIQMSDSWFSQESSDAIFIPSFSAFFDFELAESDSALTRRDRSLDTESTGSNPRALAIPS